MPTYNFTSDGDVFIYDRLTRTIDGPAAFTPREDAEYFTMTYLSGSDLYYWPTNTFQINGVEFEGTLDEFCTAAEALFSSSGGGGGDSWADIADNTIVEIASTKSLIFSDDEGQNLITATNGAANYVVGLGDSDSLVTEGGSPSVYVRRNDAGTSFVKIDANYDSYTSDAYVDVRATSGTVAKVEIAVLIGDYYAEFKVNETSIGFAGTAPVVFNNTNGVKLPNLTKAERDALTPSAGYAVYQTDNTPGLRVYNGANWMAYTETAD